MKRFIAAWLAQPKSWRQEFIIVTALALFGLVVAGVAMSRDSTALAYLVLLLFIVLLAIAIRLVVELWKNTKDAS